MVGRLHSADFQYDSEFTRVFRQITFCHEPQLPRKAAGRLHSTTFSQQLRDCPGTEGRLHFALKLNCHGKW
jgi:hypothetical protein